MQQRTSESEDQSVQEGIELQRRLGTAEPAERAEVLAEAIRELASEVLDQPALALDSNFLESGLTSARALELTQRLTTLTGIETQLVALIEHPTSAELGRYLAEFSVTAAG